MADILLDVELSIPQGQFMKFNELAQLIGKSIPETVEMCMYDKCDELLTQLKENVPSDEKEEKIIEDGGRENTDSERLSNASE